MALGLRPQGFLAPSSCLSIPDYVPDVSVRGSLCSTTADPLGWDHLGDMGYLAGCVWVTQAGCRGPELVALFSHWPSRVHAAALSHPGVAQPAWWHSRHTDTCTDSTGARTRQAAGGDPVRAFSSVVL